MRQLRPRRARASVSICCVRKRVGLCSGQETQGTSKGRGSAWSWCRRVERQRPARHSEPEATGGQQLSVVFEAACDSRGAKFATLLDDKKLPPACVEKFKDGEDTLEAGVTKTLKLHGLTAWFTAKKDGWAVDPRAESVMANAGAKEAIETFLASDEAVDMAVAAVGAMICQCLCARRRVRTR